MEPLPTLWFVTIAVLWIGYLLLEGFDLGVGMRMLFGTSEKQRRLMLNTIGPVWDGNEVWLITAGAATFAAFPLWYASLFSTLYLPLTIALVGLIFRAVAIEWRGKVHTQRWRSLWTASSASARSSRRSASAPCSPSRRSACRSTRTATASAGRSPGSPCRPCSAASPSSASRSPTPPPSWRSRPMARCASARPCSRCAGRRSLCYRSWVGRCGAAPEVQPPPLVDVVVAVVCRGWRARRPAGREGARSSASRSSWCRCRLHLHRRLPGCASVDDRPRIQPHRRNASSGDYTLGVMSIVTAFGLPLVFVYQGWTYWVFRRRSPSTHLPDAHLVLPAVASR